MRLFALFVVTTALALGGADAKKETSKKKEVKKEKTAEVQNPVVEMVTNKGTVHIELDQKKAPVTVKNFLSYVNEKYYDGTVFHRVISSFMIQGGGFEVSGKTLKQKETKDPIKLESQNGLSNKTGTIAMARTGDPNSATSQFFINVKDNGMLDHPKPDGHGYAVFGKVIKGMDVVNKIKGVGTGVKTVKAKGRDGKLSDAPFRDVPTNNVVIKSIRVMQPKKAS